MSKILKQAVKSALEQAGLSVSRFKPSPFGHLRAVPRYTPGTVQLLGRPFAIADGPSFAAGHSEIFVDEIYRFKSATATPRIIDCGSNCGLSVVYFKHIYPDAVVTGIEADPKIFELLAANTAHLDAELLNKAVSHDHVPLQFFSEGADGGRTHALSDAKDVVQIECVTLDDLIDGPVDFLKIDIEGSESSAIDACTKLELVDQMFIEYHSFQNTKQKLGEMLTKLTASGFRYYIRHQLCSPAPLTIEQVYFGMDLQLNIFLKRIPQG